jgi:hypothetical protein
MKMTFGYGGWTCIDDPGNPGLLYVRWRRDESGRLSASDTYLHVADGTATPTDLRAIPWTQYEAWANAESEGIDRRRDDPTATNGLPVLASAFNRPIMNTSEAHRNWVHAAYFADAGYPEFPKPRAYRARSSGAVGADRFVLSDGPPDGRLTDEFLQDLARAYTAATTRGERPNKAIEQSLGGLYPVRTIERWVYTARKRGFLPPTRKGAQG